jgi:cell division protein FtsL
MILRVVLAALVVANVVSALAIVETRQHHRQLFMQATRLQKLRDDLNIEFGRLQLEQATWAENNRIDQIARGRLGMLPPAGAQTLVIKR